MSYFRHHDLIDKKFGKLLIIGRELKNPNPKNRNARWLCRCDCGKEKPMYATQLIRGYSKTCGCSRHQNPLDIAVNKIMNHYKNGAKERNLEFSLTFEQFKYLIQQDCHYCGSIPCSNFKTVGEERFVFSGIDRMINEIGYKKDNCVSCCFKCNHAKNKMSAESFFDWIKHIYKRCNLASE